MRRGCLTSGGWISGFDDRVLSEGKERTKGLSGGLLSCMPSTFTQVIKNSAIVRRVRSWPRRVTLTLAILILVLVAVRVALPSVVRNQVNHRLENIPGYTGHVDDVRLHLWRGAYSMHGFGIYRRSGELKEPFFLAKDVDFSLAWHELFHRKFVSEIEIDRGQLIFVKGPTAETSQTDADRRWQDVINDLFPIDIQRLEITNGLLRYRNTTLKPVADVYVRNMHAVATGLRNRAGENQAELPAEIIVEGDSLGAGKLKLLLNAEPLAAQPHFHLSVNLDNVNLPALNESLMAYVGVDVGKGTFRMAAEMGGRDGGFQGYVKPFFENVDFKNVTDKDKKLGARIWEHLVQVFAWVVKNKARDQVGTRIPFEGRFGDAKMGFWSTVKNLFRHGFVRAFNPTVEGSIEPDNVLPDGKSANGQDVAAVKSDPPAVPRSPQKK